MIVGLRRCFGDCFLMEGLKGSEVSIGKGGWLELKWLQVACVRNLSYSRLGGSTKTTAWLYCERITEVFDILAH